MVDMNQDNLPVKIKKSLSEMLDELVAMARPLPQDFRMATYCRYVNLIMEELGQERCILVGSTKEGTRLRTKQNEGDYDILVIGDITVPVENLKHREDLPCFVHINGTFMKEVERKDLIDGEYLPATLLKKLSPSLFGHVKGLLELFLRPQSFKANGISRVTMDTDIKPGFNTVDFEDWSCDLLLPKTNPGYRHDKALRKTYAERVNHSEFFHDKSNGAVHAMEIIAKLLLLFKTKENSDSYLYQTFRPYLNVLAAEEENHVSTAAETIGDVRENLQEDHKGTEPPEINCTSSLVKQTRSKIKSVRATYNKKSMKDFIPALRLSGPPKFIHEWILRTRYWPRKPMVDAISRSQYFVVAKPAVKDEKPEIDFCLSCNLAEITLARQMPSGHKKCLLMIKAFQRTILKEYSDDVTTFHWKTAIYWMLESTDPVTYSENSKDVLNVLRDLLDYMRDRLHEGRLQHYFFPSNLFAGLERSVRVGIVEKIEAIYMNPVQNLQTFFYKVHEDQVNVIDLPFDKIMEMKKKTGQERDRFLFDKALDIFEEIGRAHSLDKQASATVIPDIVFKVANILLTDEQAKIGQTIDTVDVRELKSKLMAGLADVLQNTEMDKATRSRAEEKLVKNLKTLLSLDY
ncbi:uncharacterized protein LOC132543938 [Ylistrum balloti]|uniref:uncharacterized protein LOC132543938 n=1 Tax=Ylistrum balloti TaxID=509963 RepID=UPI002905CE0D|nr:uncharacterized protein LOC132543938 [Ylistrum balloti]